MRLVFFPNKAKAVNLSGVNSEAFSFQQRYTGVSDVIKCVRCQRSTWLNNVSEAKSMLFLPPKFWLSRQTWSGAFFRYVTEQYFKGCGEQIKEFNIAVEALGRPLTFDPKRDSIVRVEAYRLRKRLGKYYAREGWTHEIQVHFPVGKYAPEFRSPRSLPSESEPEPDSGPEIRSMRIFSIPVLAAAAIAVLAAVVLLYPLRQPAVPDSPARSAAPPSAGVQGGAVRILAGSSRRFVDQKANEWGPDRFYTNGSSASISARPIRRTHDRGLYFSRREGNFTYDIPLPPGIYELRLYFAESQYGEDQPSGGGETSRLFSIRANGKSLAEALDVVSDAGGGDTADIKIYTDVQPAEDGYLHLAFVSLAREKAFVNAIEVLPGLRGRMLPLRMVAGSRPARDSKGNVWTPESFSSGGQLLERPDPVAGTSDHDLYRHERFGHFRYVIPVAADRLYTATFHFCEQFFGTKANGVGRRVFDLNFNGRALLQNFDILNVAKPLHAVKKRITGLKPDAQGKLVFDFVPVRNYPLVNAIEIVDEGR